MSKRGAGVENAEVIDLVTHDPNSGECALIMVSTRPWDNPETQLDQIFAKANGYLAFAEGGQLLADYPKCAGAPLRFQIDCWFSPPEPVQEGLRQLAEGLLQHRIRLVVNVITTQLEPRRA